jgi:hypothetical protein
VSTTYKTLSNIMLSRLVHMHRQLEIINVDIDNRSTAGHISYICQILEKKWELSELVHQLFINSKKA